MMYHFNSIGIVFRNIHEIFGLGGQGESPFSESPIVAYRSSLRYCKKNNAPIINHIDLLKILTMP